MINHGLLKETLMKSLIPLVFVVSLVFSGQNSPADLYGKWKLIEIEVKGKKANPEKIDYFLTISENRINYNLDLNKCWVDSFSLENDSISFGWIACTELCCDGRFDTISNYLWYAGVYKLQDSVLTITNEKAILRLRKY